MWPRHTHTQLSAHTMCIVFVCIMYYTHTSHTGRPTTSSFSRFLTHIHTLGFVLFTDSQTHTHTRTDGNINNVFETQRDAQSEHNTQKTAATGNFHQIKHALLARVESDDERMRERTSHPDHLRPTWCCSIYGRIDPHHSSSADLWHNIHIHYRAHHWKHNSTF